ncbi:MAG: Asp-tRNA(Asn)/Glu-tRNA(Gln) amidotransferase subunit GatC [Proteobacteria bacterium]|nr:Asp-tRNA(Asn)/Glu-tRNA(Gln) amidotransferase subunit GatC [Pseudomonadota bacterium]
MKITDELIDKIGDLARLRIKDSEKPRFSEHLAEILDYMEDLNNVKVHNVEPMFHGCVEKKDLRPDIVIPFDAAKIMKNAHKNKDNYFEVPNIINGDDQ